MFVLNNSKSSRWVQFLKYPLFHSEPDAARSDYFFPLYSESLFLASPPQKQHSKISCVKCGFFSFSQNEIKPQNLGGRDKREMGVWEARLRFFLVVLFLVRGKAYDV